MIGYVIFTFIVALAWAWMTGRLLQREQAAFARREHTWERERRDLLDRIMHLSGQTWTPPPEPPREDAAPEWDPIDWPEMEPIE